MVKTSIKKHIAAVFVAASICAAFAQSAVTCAATLSAAGEEFKLSSLVVTRHVSYSLKQIVLTRSIEETVAGRKTSSTTRHDTLGSEATKNTRAHAADATSGSKDTNAFSTSGKLGGSVKFGIFPAISAEGGVDKQYGTTQTSENSSTSRSGTAFEREDKKSTARNSSEEGSEAETYGGYRLLFSVALKNNDITDPLQVDGKGASVRLEGLSVPVVVPYQERETFELGADEALCVFSYPIKDQVLLRELKQIDAQGAWSKITLTLVGSNFPIVSKKTKRNVLTEQSVAEQRSPTTEIEVDFGDLSRLSPWRVKQRYNRASGKRGQPVRLREALEAINGIVAEDEEMPEEVFQFRQSGDLAAICGEPTRQSFAAGDLKMFGVRFTDVSGNMTVRLPAGTALDAPLRDSTKITLFTFMLSEAAVQIRVNPERLAGFKADIESFLASGGDNATLELWKKLLAEAERVPSARISFFVDGVALEAGESVKIGNTSWKTPVALDEQNIKKGLASGGTVVYERGGKRYVGKLEAFSVDWRGSKDFGVLLKESTGPAASTGKVQLWAGGPYWADRNIGAEKPSDAGYYFWWGDTVGYKYENETWVASNGSSSGFSFKEKNVPTSGKSIATLQNEGWITTDNALAPQHDAAQMQWGGKWRMPTQQELNALCEKCDWTWTTRNGVYGYVIRGKGNYSSTSIFLPAPSFGRRLSLCGADSYTSYWSSVSDSDDYRLSRALLSYSGLGKRICGVIGISRGAPLLVRPVQGFAE